MNDSRRLRVIAVIIASGLVIPALWFAFHRGDPEAASAANRAAQRVRIDPATGKLMQGPTGMTASQRANARAAFDTSDEGLEEVVSPIRGGGVTVDLEGRFRSPLTATAGEDGEPVTSHAPLHEDAVGEK